MKIKILVLAVALTIPTASYAALATISAQWVQNGNLIRQASLQAKAVSQHILSYKNQIQQYQTMLINLKNIPNAQIQAALAPYASTLETLSQVSQAVNDVYATADQAQKIYKDRQNEMQMLQMNPADYFENEIALAKAKGGIYQQKLDKDMSALKQTEEKAAKLAGMTSQINAVVGNVQGLQLLAQQNQMIATELVQMNAQLREQSADKNKEGVRSEAEIQAEKTRFNALLKAQQENEAKNSKYFGGK